MRVIFASHRLNAWLFLVGLALLVAPDLARAQPVDVPDTWGGDISSRPRLTGDWGGLRDDLGKKKGIVLDVDLLATPQDVVSGGRSTGGNTWGNADYTLNIDTQKLGLWPGGFFKFSGDTGFASNVFNNAGTIVPVNTAALIPAPNDRTTALMNATLTQFLSPKFGDVLIKFGRADVADTSRMRTAGAALDRASDEQVSGAGRRRAGGRRGPVGSQDRRGAQSPAHSHLPFGCVR